MFKFLCSDSDWSYMGNATFLRLNLASWPLVFLLLWGSLRLLRGEHIAASIENGLHVFFNFAVVLAFTMLIGTTFNKHVSSLLYLPLFADLVAIWHMLLLWTHAKMLIRLTTLRYQGQLLTTSRVLNYWLIVIIVRYASCDFTTVEVIIIIDVLLLPPFGKIINLLKEVSLLNQGRLFVFCEQFVVLLKSREVLRPDLGSQTAGIRWQLVGHTCARIFNARSLLSKLFCFSEVNL